MCWTRSYMYMYKQSCTSLHGAGNMPILTYMYTQHSTENVNIIIFFLLCPQVIIPVLMHLSHHMLRYRGGEGGGEDICCVPATRLRDRCCLYASIEKTTCQVAWSYMFNVPVIPVIPAPGGRSSSLCSTLAFNFLELHRLCVRCAWRLFMLARGQHDP